MRRKQKERLPFFMIFPWGRVAAILFFVFFASLFVYRLSETGGFHVSRACFIALVIAVTSGLAGIYVISELWGKDVYMVLAGVMIAAVIRLLISGSGFAIITFFMDIHRSWFVLFLGVYYLVFMAVDTWLALWILRNSEMKEREYITHGNLWDIFS